MRASLSRPNRVFAYFKGNLHFLANQLSAKKGNYQWVRLPGSAVSGVTQPAAKGAVSPSVAMCHFIVEQLLAGKEVTYRGGVISAFPEKAMEQGHAVSYMIKPWDGWIEGDMRLSQAANSLDRPGNIRQWVVQILNLVKEEVPLIIRHGQLTQRTQITDPTTGESSKLYLPRSGIITEHLAKLLPFIRWNLATSNFQRSITNRIPYVSQAQLIGQRGC